MPLDALDAAQLTDPAALARALIRCASVTPHDAGALETLEQALNALGFVCRRHRFGEVDNLYARRGSAAPNFCFAGHTDVVPAGDESAWRAPPFGAQTRDGVLWGRGAADMKGAIAAFVAAVARLDADGVAFSGSISLLITGDEEGPALDGTKRLLPAIAQAGETIDHCLVGEPTSAHRVGDAVKVGRRGSLNAVIRVIGRQGHVAYPERAENPAPVLLDILTRLKDRHLDDGAPHFQPSNLEITSIDVGNRAHNVIPARASARLNIRFNPNHKGEELERWLAAEAKSAALDFAGQVEVEATTTGEAFLTRDAPYLQLLQDAIEAETGARPALSTGGGTSDARFIKDYAPVAELGLVGETIHQVDERTPLADIETLTRIYTRVLTLYAARPSP